MRLGISLPGWRSPLERFCLLAVLILSTGCTPSGTVISMKTSEASVRVGDTVQTLLTVENIADLTAFESHLSFDANALEVLEVSNGGFLNADYVVQNTFDNITGTIDYAVAQIGQPPANGSGTLLVITLRAKAPGDFPLRFRGTPAAPAGVLFSDSNGMAIQVSLFRGMVDIKK